MNDKYHNIKWKTATLYMLYFDSAIDDLFGLEIKQYYFASNLYETAF